VLADHPDKTASLSVSSTLCLRHLRVNAWVDCSEHHHHHLDFKSLSQCPRSLDCTGSEAIACSLRLCGSRQCLECDCFDFGRTLFCDLERSLSFAGADLSFCLWTTQTLGWPLSTRFGLVLRHVSLRLFVVLSLPPFFCSFRQFAFKGPPAWLYAAPLSS